MLRAVEHLALALAAHGTGVAVDAVQALVLGDLGLVQRRLAGPRAVVLGAALGADQVGRGRRWRRGQEGRGRAGPGRLVAAELVLDEPGEHAAALGPGDAAAPGARAAAGGPVQQGLSGLLVMMIVLLMVVIVARRGDERAAQLARVAQAAVAQRAEALGIAGRRLLLRRQHVRQHPSAGPPGLLQQPAGQGL